MGHGETCPVFQGRPLMETEIEGQRCRILHRTGNKLSKLAFT